MARKQKKPAAREAAAREPATGEAASAEPTAEAPGDGLVGPPRSLPRSWAAVGLALLLPGAGHAFLRRPVRSAIFFVLVVTSFVLGCSLDGRLYRIDPKQPLAEQPMAVLGNAATLSTGVPYIVARHGLGYRGDPTSAGYEYGNAFVVTAGLMNLLLIFDAWDIARGKKE